MSECVVQDNVVMSVEKFAHPFLKKIYYLTMNGVIQPNFVHEIIKKYPPLKVEECLIKQYDVLLYKHDIKIKNVLYEKELRASLLTIPTVNSGFKLIDSYETIHSSIINDPNI